MRISLASLQAFIGLGAVAGGFMLIRDPSGAAMGIPVSLLEESLFPRFSHPWTLPFHHQRPGKFGRCVPHLHERSEGWSRRRGARSRSNGLDRDPGFDLSRFSLATRSLFRPGHDRGFPGCNDRPQAGRGHSHRTRLRRIRCLALRDRVPWRLRFHGRSGPDLGAGGRRRTVRHT